MEPLGAFEETLPAALALGLGALAVLTATSLMELSRSMAEAFRGRWFAGNGRDVFHASAALVLAVALRGSGLPAAMACLYAALALTLPLLLVDALPAQRPLRALLLLGLIALACAPALLEPRSIAAALNAVARLLFR